MANIAFTVTKDGLETILNSFLNKITPADFLIKAFSNDLTVSVDNDLGDIVDTLNYTPQALPNANWAVSFLTPTAEGLYNVQVDLPFSGTGTVHGAYITDSTGTILIGAANRGSPVIYSSGESYPIQSITLPIANV